MNKVRNSFLFKLMPSPAIVKFYLVLVGGLMAFYGISTSDFVFNEQLLSEFLSGFLTIVGIQIVLWGIGIRSAFLGTDVEANQPVEFTPLATTRIETLLHELEKEGLIRRLEKETTSEPASAKWN